jgi:molybdenum cofactor cytidylyltransferase
MPVSELRVAAIVLAAGKSRRMGEPKLTLRFGEGSIIGAVVGAITKSAVSSITVVLGYHGDAVKEALEHFSVNYAVNRKPDMGMISSVQTGLRAAGDADVYIICLGDQPLISPTVLNVLINTAADSDKGIFLPIHDGKRGHPLLIKAHYRPEIAGFPLTVKLSELLEKHADDVMEVPVEDPNVTVDIDTPEDYAKLQG